MEKHDQKRQIITDIVHSNEEQAQVGQTRGSPEPVSHTYSIPVLYTLCKCFNSQLLKCMRNGNYYITHCVSLNQGF